jgi:hypothetical protein
MVKEKIWSGRCCQKFLFFGANHNPITFPSSSILCSALFAGTLKSLFFCQFWHQHAITKIKGWVQVIGANIGSFAKLLHPYLWDIQMVVGKKQFVLFIGPG